MKKFLIVCLMMYFILPAFYIFSQSQDEWEKIAMDPNSVITKREEAVGKITDQYTLKQITKINDNSSLPCLAFERLKTITSGQFRDKPNATYDQKISKVLIIINLYQCQDLPESLVANMKKELLQFCSDFLMGAGITIASNDNEQYDTELLVNAFLEFNVRRNNDSIYTYITKLTGHHQLKNDKSVFIADQFTNPLPPLYQSTSQKALFHDVSGNMLEVLEYGLGKSIISWIGDNYGEAELRKIIKPFSSSKLLMIQTDLGEYSVRGGWYLPFLTQIAVDKLIKAVIVSKLVDSPRDIHVFDKYGNEVIKEFPLIAIEYEKDSEILAAIARFASDWLTRSLAMGKISDQKLLAEIATSDTNGMVRVAATHNLTDQAVLAKLIRTDDSFFVREKAVSKTDDKNLLAEVLKNDKEKTVRKAAEERLIKIGVAEADLVKDQAKLANIAKTHRYWQVRETAVKKLISPALLAEIASKDSNYIVRRTAIEKITNQDILISIAKSDEEWSVRRAAVQKIQSEAILAEIYKTDKDDRVHDAALEKISNPALLTEFALSDEKYISDDATKKITDQNVLAQIARSGKSSWVRAVARDNLTDQQLLADIATSDSDYYVREKAVKKISNQQVLSNIAKTDEFHTVRIAAIEKLEDQQILIEIANTDKDPSVRRNAVDKILDQVTLCKIAQSDDDGLVRKGATLKITDQEVLYKIATGDEEFYVREAATQGITDENKLLKLVRSNNPARSAAARKINDQKILTDLVFNDRGSVTREAAVRQIHDQSVLAKVLAQEKDHSVRLAIIKNITDQDLLNKVAGNTKADPFERINAIRNMTSYIALNGAIAYEASYQNPVYQAFENKLKEIINASDNKAELAHIILTSRGPTNIAREKLFKLLNIW
jgi:hypothetical protein